MIFENKRCGGYRFDLSTRRVCPRFFHICIPPVSTHALLDVCLLLCRALTLCSTLGLPCLHAGGPQQYCMGSGGAALLPLLAERAVARPNQPRALGHFLRRVLHQELARNLSPVHLPLSRLVDVRSLIRYQHGFFEG